ncbi:histone acetyltransferase [Halobaculum sp. WSA2]|uniref:Histone acetyltransferase n=1 Tax=Halobaculum saliterrae TaxID=2073113 RepID=A0A6B0SQG8_9EURY|nr:histone acetyltransferase [Halobaculum saliterrae]MXR40935.1 histone acetyltransferase [Halobaculum saliterrae]
MTAVVPVTDAQPSQLFVSAAKLRDVLGWFPVDAPEAPGRDDPLPVFGPEDVPFEVRGEVLLADGHTRAVAAVLTGADALHVERVPAADRREFSLDVYETCVDWCVDAGVTDPRDLVGRVVSAETHEREWVERCRAIE